MFGLGPATRIYVALGATDMRKGYDGLYGLVRDKLGLEDQDRASVLVRECQKEQAQDFILGWHRPLELRQTAGTWKI